MRWNPSISWALPIKVGYELMQLDSRQVYAKLLIDSPEVDIISYSMGKVCTTEPVMDIRYSTK